MANAKDVAFGFIEEVSRFSGPEEILSHLFGIAGTFGFESFCISGMPDPGEEFAPYVLLNGWPHGWLEHYNAQGYVHVDPVIKRVKSSSMPFEWREATFDPLKSPGAAAVMNEARSFGLADGFCVPIYSTSGFQAGVSFGGRTVELSPDRKAALHLIAIYAHNRVRELKMSSGNKAARRAVMLTSREIECLRWCADGKTNWEISRILTISEKTVEKHVGSAARKLGVVNRVQAVAEGFRAKLLS